MLGAPAAAQDLPQLDVQGLGQLGYENDHPSGRRASANFTLKLRLDIAAELTPTVTVIGLMRVFPVLPARADASRVLGGEGLLAEELFGEWRSGGATVRVGKFTPNFARAWFLAPGLFGDLFAADAQIREQVGIEAGYAVATANFGTQAITLADTFADRTVLGQTLITDRGRLRLSNGGPSNTDAPRSYTLAYDGAALPVADGRLSYHLAYAVLGRGRGDPAQETLAVAAVNMALPTSSGAEIRPLLEVVRRWNPDGKPGTADILTAGIEMIIGEWYGNFVAAGRTRHPAGGAALHDGLLQATIGTTLAKGLNLSAGYLLLRAGGSVTHAVGVELSYAFSRCGTCTVFDRRHF